jgi:hypothetical protein
VPLSAASAPELSTSSPNLRFRNAVLAIARNAKRAENEMDESTSRHPLIDEVKKQSPNKDDSDSSNSRDDSPRFLHDDEPQSAQQRVVVRDILPGDTINSLCALRVWGRCVESVRASVASQCYRISTHDFTSIFEDDPATMEHLRKHMVMTSFRMMTSTTDAPTKYGVPLFMYSKKEIERREQLYSGRVQSQQKRQEEERRLRMQHLMASPMNTASTPVRTSGDEFGTASSVPLIELTRRGLRPDSPATLPF